MMRGVLMLVVFIRRDVPAAIVAGGRLLIARIAQQWPALEILFKPGLIVRGEIAGIARQRQVVAAAVALVFAPLGQEGDVMIVCPTADLPGTAAQGTRGAH